MVSSKVESRRSKVVVGAAIGAMALLWSGAVALGGPPNGGAATLGRSDTGAWLAVDGGGAWVREAFGFGEGTAGEVSEVRWEGVPGSVDLSSVALWNVQRPWPVKAWRREGGDVVLELAEPLSTAMECSLTYRLGGIWAEKEVREDGGGRVRVGNATGRAFPGARVAVVDTGEPVHAAKAPGRIDVNPAAPLSSLWVAPEPVRRPGAGMDAGMVWTVDVPANGTGEVEWDGAEAE